MMQSSSLLRSADLLCYQSISSQDHVITSDVGPSNGCFLVNLIYSDPACHRYHLHGMRACLGEQRVGHRCLRRRALVTEQGLGVVFWITPLAVP